VRKGATIHQFSPAIAIVAALLCIIAAACGGSDDNGDYAPGPTVTRPTPEGDPRSVALGFTAMPAEQTTDSYIQAFATAAQYGEAILIQRTPPWAEFFPNAQISSTTIETTRLETALLGQYDHLQLVFAIDPTDPNVQRARLADVPPGVSEGFRDEDMRQAFIAYVRYVVRNYEPEYLAIGVEVNMLRDRDREQYDAFVSLYAEAYANAKDANPDTKVFPTFQMEDIEGSLGEVHPPRWEALADFTGRMDVLAVSTYPYLTDISTAGDILEHYYNQLTARFAGEVMIVDAAYPSAPLQGYPLVGTEEEQARFVERLLNDAEASGFSAVIWRAALDPSYAREGTLAAFRDIGLRKGDGTNKAAWGLWETWARRPYADD